jgi:hypothetical protein
MTTATSIPSSHNAYDAYDVAEGEIVRIGYDDNGNGYGASVDQVLEEIQSSSSSDNSSHPAVVLYLYLGYDYTTQHFRPEDDRVQRALEGMVVTTYKTEGRRWKRLVLEFSTPPGKAVGLHSKDESRWFKLERHVKEQTSKFATRLQRKLDLDETEIRVDGNVRSDIQPTGNFVNHGVAVISFPKVRHPPLLPLLCA